jgi:hypothetical protein
MSRLSNTLPTAALAVILALALVPLAGPAPGRERGGEGARAEGGLTAAQAGEIARQQTGGRVLGVTPSDGGFRVKVLTPQGEVRIVFVAGR